MKLLLAFLFPFLLFPQDNHEKIVWNETKELSWQDFRGTPVQSASFVASTNTGISFNYSYSFDNGTVNLKYSVESFFYPHQSWFQPKLVSPYILKHEQMHFDISELHARMLKKSISEKTFSKKVKSEMESVYRLIERQRRAMQAKFDTETDHSRNEEKEIQWEKYIAQKLTEYESWN